MWFFSHYKGGVKFATGKDIGGGKTKIKMSLLYKA